MKTILVPLDGSELATRILAHVRTLAANLSAKVRLIHVLPDAHKHLYVDHHHNVLWRADTPLLEKDSLQRQVYATLRQNAESYLEVIARNLRSDGFDVEIDIHFGHTAQCIIETARQPEIVMTAMVTHGYSGLRRWTMGSVTEKVLHASPVPVYVVRGDTQPIVTEPPVIERLLLPLDGSDFARQALSVATELAVHTQAAVHLLHAVQPTDDAPALVRAVMNNDILQQAMAERQQWGEAQLQAASDEIGKAGIWTSSRTVVGHPAEAIIEAAQQQHSDVIVMATHGYSGLRLWALGSVANKVMHATSTPLLLVRASE